MRAEPEKDKPLVIDMDGMNAKLAAVGLDPQGSELGFVEECSGRVRRVIGHYYVCSF